MTNNAVRVVWPDLPGSRDRIPTDLHEHIIFLAHSASSALAAVRNILTHRSAIEVDFARIQFGRKLPIDPHCIISCAKLPLGGYTHSVAGFWFAGRGAIKLAGFAAISNQGLIYSSKDDYSDFSMTSPMVPARHTNVISADVTHGHHALLGAGFPMKGKVHGRP